MTDPNYLKDHVAMQAFLDSHPLVKADPRAFVSPANADRSSPVGT